MKITLKTKHNGVYNINDRVQLTHDGAIKYRHQAADRTGKITTGTVIAEKDLRGPQDHFKTRGQREFNVLVKWDNGKSYLYKYEHIELN